MSKTDQGVLIFNEWFEAMKALPPREHKALIMAMYNYQIHDIPPPEFDGLTKVLATIIFAFIEKRKIQAERGRKGAEARYSGAGQEADELSRFQ